MSTHAAFIDIHCHLLPGIDDGAADWETTLAMARMAAADGIAAVIATPHQLGAYRQRNRGEAIRRLVAEVQTFLRKRQVPLHVLPGADVRIEPDMISLIQAGDVLTLADRRKHVLLELPHEVFLPLDRILQSLDAAGMQGILSHPERNHGILRQPELVRPLVEQGCLMQITAGSLAGSFGPQTQQFSDWMIQQGLVHFVSTDAHGARSRRPRLAKAFDRVVDLTDEQTALDLFRRNPACVVDGRAVEPGVRRRPRAGWKSWFSGRKAS